MMENVNGLSLELIIHPGETLKEVLEDRNMTQDELAIRTGFSSKHVSEVINGKKGISSSFAHKLYYALNIPMSFWLNLQNIYDEQILELKEINNVTEEEFNVLEELKEITTYCEKEEIIPISNDKTKLLLNTRRFLNINNLNDIVKLPLLQMAFRGSDKTKVNNNILYAWIKICEYYSDKVNIDKEFNSDLLITKYDEIKSTMFLEANKMIDKLKSIFEECGIIFEVVKHFRGAPVQGFIQKRNNKVTLCMTIRQAYSDIFWFTLFHEIYHLINNDFSDVFIDYNFTRNDNEESANNFARDKLINNEDYEEFKKKGMFDKKSILDFSNRQKIVPGILVGRLERDFNDYSFLSDYRDKYIWND